MNNKGRKERMMEPEGATQHQLKDKGYKKLFENKEMFLEFLQTFVKEDWVEDIQEEDLVRVDKEYVLQDYRKKEADIVYKMRLKNPATGEKKEVILYILLELQSGVDRMMPYRLLMYMVQIWRQELTNVKYIEAQDEEYRLPAIVPIVLYNGSREWNVAMTFKDLQNEAERFGGYLVDFQYILVNVNNYKEEELIKIANGISCVIMMDQTIVSKDKEVMGKRLNEIVQMKQKLPAEKMDLIIEWLREVLLKRFPEKEAEKVIEDLKEGRVMTYAIERLFDNMEEQAMKRAKMEEKIETAQKGIQKNLPVDVISELTGLPIEQIEKMKKENGIGH